MRELPKFVALRMLRAYKWAISPMLPPACRFVPTCSEYAAEAVERYGVLRGGWKASIRLLRCHPFSRGGYDPVVTSPNPRLFDKLRAGSLAKYARRMGHPEFTGHPANSMTNEQSATTPAHYQCGTVSALSRTL